MQAPSNCSLSIGNTLYNLSKDIVGFKYYLIHYEFYSINQFHLHVILSMVINILCILNDLPRVDNQFHNMSTMGLQLHMAASPLPNSLGSV